MLKSNTDKFTFLQELQHHGVISGSDVEKALEIHEESGAPIGKILLAQNMLTETALYDYIHNFLGMNPTADYSKWSYGISGSTVPKFNVSGDFYGFFPLDDEEIAVTLCDVCGKGVEAGFLTVILASFLQEAIRMQALIPAAIIRKLNHTCISFFGEDQFAAFAVVVLNMHRGTLDYCCAGCPPILVYRREGNYVEELEVSGIPIGIYENFYYSSGHTRLHRGDVALLYSDGAYEAQNFRGSFFGLNGLKEALRAHSKKSVRRLIGALKRDLRVYTLLKGLNDDTTYVAIKKLGRRV